MQRRDNYRIQADQAKARFLTYDQDALIRKCGLTADDRYLYTRLLDRLLRIDRRSGDLEVREGAHWLDANTYHAVMTVLDWLCDCREDRHLSGRWKNMEAFGHQFHRNLLEEARNPMADRFDADPGLLERACARLEGRPVPGADIGFSVELFDGLRLAIQFWHGDEEFAPRLRYLWDENAGMYLRYETMYFAVSLVLDRITELTGADDALSGRQAAVRYFLPGEEEHR